MKAYTISKGTPGLLLKNNSCLLENNYGGHWDTEEFVTRKDLMFTDVVIDSIRVYNQNSGFKTRDTVYQLAERGYMVFQSDSDSAYMLAVPYHSVNTK